MTTLLRLVAATMAAPASGPGREVLRFIYSVTNLFPQDSVLREHFSL